MEVVRTALLLELRGDPQNEAALDEEGKEGLLVQVQHLRGRSPLRERNWEWESGLRLSSPQCVHQIWFGWSSLEKKGGVKFTN